MVRPVTLRLSRLTPAQGMAEQVREAAAKVAEQFPLRTDYTKHDTMNGIAAAIRAMPLPKSSDEGGSGDAVRQFRIGDRVSKTKGSSWTGRVVGFYSTSLTPEGYAVESENEPGSVQIYPVAALSASSANDTVGVGPMTRCPHCHGKFQTVHDVDAYIASLTPDANSKSDASPTGDA
jgi:hypothetical protein